MNQDDKFRRFPDIFGYDHQVLFPKEKIDGNLDKYNAYEFHQDVTLRKNKFDKKKKFD
jgi:hypothetical protein